MGGTRQGSCSFWEMGGVMFANNKYLHNTLHTHLNNQYFCDEKSKSAGLVALPLHQVKFINNINYYRRKIKTAWMDILTEKYTVAWSIVTKDHIDFGIKGLQRAHLSLHGQNRNS